MSCVALFAWRHHTVIWTMPLILGIVAAALTDIDDRLTGRLKNIVITLVCFAIATISVELLFPHPLLFVLGLGLSSWIFIMLGALGQRYATIAFGAILIALPLGLATAIYMAEIADNRIRNILKPIIELLAGISLAGFGFFGLVGVRSRITEIFGVSAQTARCRSL